MTQAPRINIERRSFRVSLALVLLATAGMPLRAGKPQTAHKPDLRISVHVYNYAQVSSSLLGRAKKETARILREAGIEISWSDCSVSPAHAPAVPACGQRRLTNLVLRIIPEASASLNKTMLGFALPAPEGAIHATIFDNRVQELADRRLASRRLILALAIAHEIGHLLLGAEEHSPAGLMKVQWGQGDFDRAKVELLRFSSRQAGIMQAEVVRRDRSVRASLGH